MNPVQRALWCVESHSREEILLEDIAAVCGVSPYHLTRTFATSMGLPLMRYVRGRRLSEAARRLACGGEQSILDLALEAGYNSHEAFTRAFREQFNLTPEQLRASGRLEQIKLVEAIPMKDKPTLKLEHPRMEDMPPRVFAGLVERHDCAAPAGIPGQWQRFIPWLGNIPAQAGDTAYGLNYNFDGDGKFDYMCAVEVRPQSELPQGLVRLKVPAQRYAVFAHREHISSIRGTFSAIWSWFPSSNLKPADGPTMEVYTRDFDPTTGLGGLEIWIPVGQTA